MKTAISIPDELFGAAERAANRLGLTRSELFRKALVAFLERNDDKLVTDALNQIYTGQPKDSELHPTVLKMQTLSVPQDEW